ncbi:unnamed protein product [Macrosiphum euphorbiae]|uniref:Peptidase S1 domain-containing protein n=1 Tax=Macrosiphum euphorbiae TaxID=13131 RepID=A0AAV0W0I7_9HEMI|nr:unnamed protein product [Macrosiphum euphorbiae]
MYAGGAAIEVAILRVIRHELYNVHDVTNDIALLKLNNSVGFNRNIQPICLPILSHLRTDTFVGSFLIVLGWGATRFRGPRATSLMEVAVRAMNNSECKRAFDKNNVTIYDTMLCAGSSIERRDACQGDSGGPLMLAAGSHQHYLVGIVSFGYKCGEPGYPGVYTRVTSYIKWIEDNMN